MTSLSAYPPEGFELRLIQRFVRLQRQRVLEIGCGDGRLTVQYAPLASSVVAIDPERLDVDAARSRQQGRAREKVEFRVGSIERMAAAHPGFDVALFSWSL